MSMTRSLDVHPSARMLNRERALSLMAAHGVDALVVASPANVCYVSGYRSPLEERMLEFMITPGGSADRAVPTYAILAADGSTMLVVPARFAATAAWLDVDAIIPYGVPVFGDGRPDDLPAATGIEMLFELLREPAPPASPEKALVAGLRARGLDAGSIGVELDAVSVRANEALAEVLSRARVRDCSNLLRLLRAVKSSEGIERLARATEIAEDAAIAVLGSARPGRSAAELTSRLRALLAERDAELEHLAVGLLGLGFDFAPRHSLAAGDAFLVDFGCIHEACISDSAVTVVLGDVPAGVLERYEVVRDCVAAGAEAARPGVRASAVHAAMVNSLGPRGEAANPPKGHGIGLEIREYPIVAPASDARLRDDCLDIPADLELEQGMVINLETHSFRAGSWSIAVEQSFVVGSGGARPLVDQDRSAPLVVTG